MPYELTYLEGTLMEYYLHGIQIVQDFAAWNQNDNLDELIKRNEMEERRLLFNHP